MVHTFVLDLEIERIVKSGLLFVASGIMSIKFEYPRLQQNGHGTTVP